jgi:hypothetical protein
MKPGQLLVLLAFLLASRTAHYLALRLRRPQLAWVLAYSTGCLGVVVVQRMGV